jgi:hypothetical protein
MGMASQQHECMCRATEVAVSVQAFSHMLLKKMDTSRINVNTPANRFL